MNDTKSKETEDKFFYQSDNNPFSTITTIDDVNKYFDDLNKYFYENELTSSEKLSTLLDIIDPLIFGDSRIISKHF